MTVDQTAYSHTITTDTILKLATLPHGDVKRNILQALFSASREGKIQALVLFLTLLFGPFLDENEECDQFIEINFRNIDDKFKTKYYELKRTNFERIAKELLVKNLSDCAFIGICPRLEIRSHETFGYELASTNNGISQSAVVWLDIDAKDIVPDNISDGKKQILSTIKSFLPIQPSVLLDSGNGMHAYFLLDKPYPIDLVTEICWRLVHFIQIADQACTNASRILRAPMSVNRKNRNHLKQTGFRKIDGHRYTLDDFAFLPQADKTKPLVLKRIDYSKEDVLSREGLEEILKRCDERLLDKLTIPTIAEYQEKYGRAGSDRTRSGRDIHCICQMVKSGFSPNEIMSVFFHLSVGVGEKFHEKGSINGPKYLTLSIEKAIAMVNEEQEKNRNLMENFSGLFSR